MHHTDQYCERLLTPKYSLSNLFNAVPRHSALRLDINQALVKIASENDELEQLQFTEAEVDRWLSEWDVSPEQKSAYLKTLVNVYAQTDDQ